VGLFAGFVQKTLVGYPRFPQRFCPADARAEPFQRFQPRWGAFRKPLKRLGGDGVRRSAAGRASETVSTVLARRTRERNRFNGFARRMCEGTVSTVSASCAGGEPFQRFFCAEPFQRFQPLMPGIPETVETVPP